MGKQGGYAKPDKAKQPEATKSFTSTWTATKPQPFLRLRYHARYDYEDAKLDEWYTLEEKYVTLFRSREKWREKSTWRYPDGGKAYTRFDLKRAKKLAEDFGIDLPEPTHRLSTWRTKAKKPTRTNTKSAQSHPSKINDGGKVYKRIGF